MPNIKAEPNYSNCLFLSCSPPHKATFTLYFDPSLYSIAAKFSLS